MHIYVIFFSRCKLNNNETNIFDNKNNCVDQDDLKTSVKPADHFLLHIKDEPMINKNSSSSPISVTNYLDPNNSKKTPPPTSSSPAYSDISDEDPTPNEQILPPSTINLLTATNGKIDENGNNLHSSSSSLFLPTNGGLNNSDISNPAWTAQMLFQQFGPFMQQQPLVTDISTKSQSITPNR
jgi:hypothetical protein